MTHEHTPEYFPVAADGFVLVDEHTRPAVVQAEDLSQVMRIREEPESVRTTLGLQHEGATPDVRAVRVSRDHLETLARRLGLWVQDSRIFGSDQAVSRAVALLRHRDQFRHDPADGSLLRFDDDGVVGHGRTTRSLFPRIDPAVIGMVRLAGSNDILLGKNRRSDYYSLIAGYVDPGETLEQAFAREVLEETGRRIRDIRYWGSQPWAISGSLMIAFTAITDDRDAVADTDHELADVRWVTRADMAELPLARPGSIAHAMLMQWMKSEEE